jgi:hypothetical protein
MSNMQNEGRKSASRQAADGHEVYSFITILLHRAHRAVV